MLQQSWLARALALVLAIAASLSPAATAVAHGHAHEHLAEAGPAERGGARQDAHDAAHDAGVESHEHGARELSPRATAGAGSALAFPALRAAGGPDDHAHPRLDAAAAARHDLRLDPNVALPAVLLVGALALPPAQSVTLRLLCDAPPRAGPGGAPPPPPRAPPLG